ARSLPAVGGARFPPTRAIGQTKREKRDRGRGKGFGPWPSPSGRIPGPRSGASPPDRPPWPSRGGNRDPPVPRAGWLDASSGPNVGFLPPYCLLFGPPLGLGFCFLFDVPACQVLLVLRRLTAGTVATGRGLPGALAADATVLGLGDLDERLLGHRVD